MLVAGETQFNLIGFILVMTASMLSGLRWTITQVLLQGTDSHGTLLMPVTSLSTSKLVIAVQHAYMPFDMTSCHISSRLQICLAL